MIPLRKVISEIENNFDGSFPEHCQTKSVPIELISFIRLLVDGLNVDNDHFSQASLTISQLIVANFKQISRKRTSQYSRSIRSRETPVQLYTSLKLYSTIRSRRLIDHLFQLGICSSYDRVLEITKSLSDHMTRQYQRDGAFCPSKLKKNVFTMMAKDNCDHNASSTTATQHYHGTSITVMQYPTREKPGDQIDQSAPVLTAPSSSRKVMSLPSSYTKTKPVFLSKGKLYAPKIDEVCTSYDSQEMFDLEWSK